MNHYYWYYNHYYDIIPLLMITPSLLSTRYIVYHMFVEQSHVFHEKVGAIVGSCQEHGSSISQAFVVEWVCLGQSGLHQQ